MPPTNQTAAELAPVNAGAPECTASQRAPQLEGTTSVLAPLNVNIFSAPPPRLVRPPLVKPPFTKDMILEMIPKHCFVKSTLLSFSHLALDLAIVAALGYAATHIQYAPLLARWLLWPLYIYAQGCVLTGVWVIAHECGHQAFSDSMYVNDTVGWVLHSALLVPYHSWRITHKNHHSHTCHAEKDEVFCPSTREDYAQEMMQDIPLYHVWQIFVMLTFGWCVLSASLLRQRGQECGEERREQLALASLHLTAHNPPPPPPFP